MKSYGDWIFEIVTKGLPRNTPPPRGYETYDAWYKRLRGLDPATGKPVSDLEPSLPGTRATTASLHTLGHGS